METTEKLKNTEVKETSITTGEKTRSQNVTAKTLKAWMEQSRRIANEKLTTPEQTRMLADIMASVKTKFIEQTF